MVEEQLRSFYLEEITKIREELHHITTFIQSNGNKNGRNELFSEFECVSNDKILNRTIYNDFYIKMGNDLLLNDSYEKILEMLNFKLSFFENKLKD